MLDLINKTISKFFGTKSERDLKELTPVVEQIRSAYTALEHISNDELRAKSESFKARIEAHVSGLKKEMEDMKAEAEKEDIELSRKEDIYREIDKLKKTLNTQTEEILAEIHPEAFAVIKETARRFTNNETIEATATEHDRNLAANKPHITIVGDKVQYKNSWLAAGNEVVWNMVHYDVQLIGGTVLHQGKISEMATGEGKTLVATLPIYLNALTGRGVHVVTVNDYLARRDSEWNAPIFEFLGLTLDCIDKHEPNSDERREAYMADIVYGTNNEFGFDYLRDNMARSPEDMVQREHFFAIVDEVDSVLIDDARTPLIISGPTPKGDSQEFFELKPMLEQLVNVQKTFINTALNDAKKLLSTGNEKEGGLALLRAHRGLPKSKALIKFLSEVGMKAILQKTENFYMQDQQKEMHKVDAELYFVIDEKNNSIELTDKGIEYLSKYTSDANFFIMPDVGSVLADIEKGNLSDDEKINRKDELMRDFSVKSERIHTVNQLLKAYTLFEKDVEYIITEGKVKIVDEQTGRVLDGRRYSDGLHQAIEAKENVKVEAATQTFATITLQNYFRMYHKLAGMTGTAETEAGEFWQIYKLDVVTIPTNRKITRQDEEDLVYKTKREKYNAVIEEIVKLTQAGRPVLVGTTSVEVSELLSRMLKLRNIKHNVLNAKLHKKEADIVAEAGLSGTVTIATNMAGRGTDIKLGPGVKDAGGLAIIGTERHESRRVDRQLRGRAGRQGDPGTSQFFVSLEDDLMRLFGSDRIIRLMDRMGVEEGEVIQHSMITKSIERAQRKVEENNFGIRKRLLEYDDVMNAQREVIYTKRRHALFGDRLSIDIVNMVYDVAENVLIQYREDNDYEGLRLELIRLFSTDIPFDEETFHNGNVDELVQTLYNAAMEHYKHKSGQVAEKAFPVIRDVYQNQGQQIENIVVPFTDSIHGIQVLANLQKAYDSRGKSLVTEFEKTITLSTIDDSWKQHLRDMDDLKQSVQNAVYEQKDPLLIYKFESFELFRHMITQVNKDIVSFLFKGIIPEQQQAPVREAAPVERMDMRQMRATHDEGNGGYVSNSTAGGTAVAEAPPQPKLEPMRAEMKIGRNDPCPCGSGKKYKNCHGA